MESTDMRRAAQIAAQGLRDGTMTLGHLAGVTEEELRAIGEVAKQAAATGETQQAIAIHGLVISLAPFSQESWRALAELYAALGEDAIALACYQILALLGGHTPEILRRKAACLENIGEVELAEKALELAEHESGTPVAVGGR